MAENHWLLISANKSIINRVFFIKKLANLHRNIIKLHTKMKRKTSAYSSVFRNHMPHRELSKLKAFNNLSYKQKHSNTCV